MEWMLDIQLGIRRRIIPLPCLGQERIVICFKEEPSGYCAGGNFVYGFHHNCLKVLFLYPVADHEYPQQF